MELVSPQADKFDRSLKCYAHCPLRCAGNANKGGISLFKKEISLPYTLPEKISIASEQLKELQCLPIALPARGVAALALQDDLPLLLLSAVAQPLAALLPYGCGTPLAGAALPIL